jgi:multicomponent Na+:H+ antiporter subunit B
MTRARRIALGSVGLAGLAVLLAWGFAGLEPFGHYPGPYGTILNAVEPQQRHAANVVGAVTFDYRGFDTLGEELILFCAVAGVAFLLRERREEDTGGVRDRVSSDAVRAAGLLAVPVVVLLAVDTILHGYLTPGGGFQGGVVAAAGLLLVYLAGDWRSLRRASPTRLVDSAEATGAGGFALVGVATLVAGGAFLQNMLPLGTFGTLTSAGTIPVENLCVGLEVSAAFVLVFVEFLEEIVSERAGGA